MAADVALGRLVGMACDEPGCASCCSCLPCAAEDAAMTLQELFEELSRLVREVGCELSETVRLPQFVAWLNRRLTR